MPYTLSPVTVPLATSVLSHPPNDRAHLDLRLGSGHVIPTTFIPPSDISHPQELFPSTATGYPGSFRRFIHRTDPSQLLIYTAGACLSTHGEDGTNLARAGCGFVFRDAPHPECPGDAVDVSFRLEAHGPTGEVHGQTTIRAELRAVIAALRFRVWAGEGFRRIVIATDSEYVVKGITEWVRKWLVRGWRTVGTGAVVKNKDLWLVLLGEMERLHRQGMEVKFWRIPWEWNGKADWAAKMGAGLEAEERFLDFGGFLV